jgi:hypothetical protein
MLTPIRLAVTTHLLLILVQDVANWICAVRTNRVTSEDRNGRETVMQSSLSYAYRLKKADHSGGK